MKPQYYIQKHLNLKTTAVTLLLIASVQTTFGQEFHASLTTEIETDFHDKNDWVNQLRLNFTMPLGKHVHFDIATLSVAQTREEGVANDYQTFSNIYADNMALALAVAGLRWESGKSMLFAGVRNIDEDYFTSPVASLFTNSSCGLYPTVSMNTPLATYPLAAVGVHYAYNSDGWQAMASIYNGAGHRHFTGSDNAFRICPKTDGVFGIASVSYNHKESEYIVGGTYYNGRVQPDIPIDDVTPPDGRYTNVALWANVEQSISPSLKLMAHYSGSPTHGAQCYSYIGAGIEKDVTLDKLKKTVQLGLFSDYAHFAYGKEWATEATAKLQLNDKCYIQPALHFIRTDGTTSFVGLMRLGYEL